MAKKKFDKKNILYLVIGALIVLVLIKPGSETIIERTYIQNNTVIERLEEDPLATIDCKFTADQTRIIEGQTVTGRIKDGKLTDCDIYADYNNLGWTKVAEGKTTFSGILELSEVLNLVGIWDFAAICGTCTTNQVDVEVLSKTGDYDGDGSTNEEEIGQGTDPFDPNDYPEAPLDDYDCMTICLSKDYASGRGPVSSSGYCNYPEVMEWLDLYNGCCCTPVAEDAPPESDNPNYGVSCWIDTITPSSQADCSVRTDCIPTKDCIYFPSSILGPAKCACVEDEGDSCFDEDGSQIGVRGTCTDASGNSYVDYCRDGDYTRYLNEYDCHYDDTCQTMTIYDCYAYDSFCYQGECVRHEEYCQDIGTDFGYDYLHSEWLDGSTNCGTYAYEWCIDEYGGTQGASSTLGNAFENQICCWTCVAE